MPFWILVWIASILLNAHLARVKHRGFAAWMVLALFFGLLSTLILALLPPLPERFGSSATRPCPFCQAPIPAAATRCVYCRHELAGAAKPICTRCGAVNDPGDHYCAQCGQPIMPGTSA